MNEIILINEKQIQNKIYTIRGAQVMLDRDLAELYSVETRALKQAVKRNIERFPSDFMFELTEIEIDSMVSQSVIPSKKYFGGAKPFVFTEQGVATISGVLTNKVASEIHINIMRAFVQMRRFISNNALIFERLDSLEKKQFQTDDKIDTILNAIEFKDAKPKQGIFYDGQMFDAYVFVSDLIKSAKSSIVLIDNYVDESVLMLLSKRASACKATIYTKSISKELKLDLQKHNSQYAKIEIKEFKDAHDRFMILDEKEIYHIGASLKDLGKKWFAFSRFESSAIEMLGKLS